LALTARQFLLALGKLPFFLYKRVLALLECTGLFVQSI
jgi:hypothetical protein